jgi:hypothetical protein
MVQTVLLFFSFYYDVSHPTACVTCMWAGVGSVWQQKMLDPRKILKTGTDFGAKFLVAVLAS